uniref:Uncharacterized protein n=1 Tax=Nelumbo nucifera TaxID=4432 RepID=A0A822ZPA7_NELNU|nr:TPA_asm: hypothetical protein HUJ06_016580 [Nelumbo nucifera]
MSESNGFVNMHTKPSRFLSQIFLKLSYSQ